MRRIHLDALTAIAAMLVLAGIIAGILAAVATVH